MGMKMKNAFKNVVSATDNMITKDQFLKALAENKPVKDTIESVGIPAGDAELLYTILDADGSGSVSMQEFMDACSQIRGATDQSWNNIAMQARVRRVAKQMQTLTDV